MEDKSQGASGSRSSDADSGASSSTLRLPSFKMPRDLTLGGNVKLEKPKKAYVPNLNVQRNKKKEETTTSKNGTAPAKNKNQGKGRERKDRQNRNSNLIQSTGLFSEGMAESQRGSTSRGGGYSTRSSADNTRDMIKQMEKPKLNLNKKVDREEEEKKLKQILRDDFLDDDGDDADLEYAPVKLPFTPEEKAIKTKCMKVLDSSDEDDVKPVILENGEAKSHEAKSKSKKLNSKVWQQITETKSNEYILLQLPDCLPGYTADDDSNDYRPRQRGITAEVPPAAAAAAAQPKAQQETNKSKTDLCTLNSLKAGQVGKLQIRRSGKAYLVFGDNSLIVEEGSQICFRQDLVTAKLDAEKGSGDLISMGPVVSTLICSPNWETMLSSL